MTEKILITDDEPAVLKFLCRTSKGQGSNLDRIKELREILLKLRKSGYDLIILDI